MPRPTRSTKTETRTVTLPAHLWEFIDKQDWDPVKLKPRYGHLCRFFEPLIGAHINHVKGLNSLGKDNE